MIIVKPIAGLCNRMRVINSCLQLQKRNPNAGQIQMIWEKNELLNCDFNDIFEPVQNIEIINSHRALSYFLQYHCHSSLSLMSKLKKHILELTLRNYQYYDNDNIFDLRFKKEYWDNCKNDFVINTYSDFYDGEIMNSYNVFRPVSHLQNLINLEVKKFIKPTIGVHIRRTDNIKSIEKSTTTLFVKYLSDLLEKDSNQLFFLATDDLTVETLLKKKFENFIITQTNKEVSRTNKKGIEHAVVDLYALSNTNSIIGSYYSSFSRTAARINKIPLKIIE